MPLAAILLTAAQRAAAQAPPPAWNFTQFFQYNIENLVVNTTTPGTWNVRVIFSATNPPNNNVAWNITRASPFRSAGAGVTIESGWDPSTDFTNTGSVNALLSPVITSPPVLGTAAAHPIQVGGFLSKATGATHCAIADDCPGVANITDRLWIERSVTPITFKQAVTTGQIGLEGHPVCKGLSGCPTTTAPFANNPVQSAVRSFSFMDTNIPPPQ